MIIDTKILCRWLVIIVFTINVMPYMLLCILEE